MRCRHGLSNAPSSWCTTRACCCRASGRRWNCAASRLNIGLASASPLHMQQQVLKMFDLEATSISWFPPNTCRTANHTRRVYLIAAERLGSDPLRCITLEDSFNGMIATKAARMRSIVIPAAEYRHDPRWPLADHQLETLEQLTPPILPDLRRWPPAPRLSAQRHKGSVQQNKRNSVSLLLNRHAVVIMLGDRESDGPRNVVTATQRFRGGRRSRRCVLKTALVSSVPHRPIARFTPVSDDLLRIAVTSRCKTGKNKQLVTG